MALTPAAPNVVAPAAGPTGQPVQDTLLACPAAPANAGKNRYGVARVPLGDGRGGVLTVDPVPAAGPPGRGRVAEVAAERKGLTAHGTEGAAPGLLAWRAAPDRPTAVGLCSSPRAGWWFVGAGAALDHRSTLVLSNVDAGPAVVDVRVLSPDGEVDVADVGARGVTLAPGERRAFPLVQLAPQADDLAVQVHATRGRVVAAVSDTYATRPAATPGREWLPEQAAPQRRLQLAGVPGGTSERRLLVGNPSPLEAVVRVELLGPNGRFLPVGLEQTTVSPGTVGAVDLSRALPGDAVTIRIRATAPVVASVRSESRGEVSYAVPAPRLLGPAAAPVLGRSTAQLTAGSGLARAAVTSYTATGRELAEDTETLAARSTVAVRLPARAAYVVVRPVTGRVSGAVVYARGASSLPLRELPLTLRRPSVAPLS